MIFRNLPQEKCCLAMSAKCTFLKMKPLSKMGRLFVLKNAWGS